MTTPGPTELNQYSAAGGNFGVKLADGGTVINSGANSLLYGSIALDVQGAAATVANGGQIQATEGLGTAIKLTAGGTIVNGAYDSTPRRRQPRAARRGVLTRGASPAFSNAAS